MKISRSIPAIALIILAVLLSACGNRNPGVDAQGNCVPEFVSEYEGIFDAYRYARDNDDNPFESEESLLKDVQSQCQEFEYYRGGFCTTDQATYGSVKYYNGRDTEDICGSVDNQLSDIEAADSESSDR